MKYLLSLISIFIMANVALAQKELSYFLPDSVTYDSAIPTPESVIGHQVGEWHVTHDKLVYYMRAIAEASDRITIEETGVTYEDRPQLLLTITHPDNLANIDEIKSNHKQLTNPDKSSGLDIAQMPSVIMMGFSIHGNEPSGSNASMLTAYYLAAAQGQDIEDKLKNVVVLLDPSFNPDGLNRFATWANMHKSENLVTDPNDREFNEAWPGGRTNHYWFDMNRDWLPVQLAESQNRIAQFHAWKPNILTDHHEMGTNSTFFFQPGIPERTHPITPQKNQDLTGQIGEYHAEFLDRVGSLYYSKESFDDFYYGKGSTFPDVQGAIGILFEQASSRGHAQESVNGVLEFPFTIKNQFTASLSTLQAGYEMRGELLGFQRDFYKNSVNMASEANEQAWVVSDQDVSKLYRFAEMLDRHEIDVFKLAKNTNGFQTDNSYIIPMNQYQSRLIKAVFDVRTSFTDSLFYDVSAFNMGMSYNLNYKSLDKRSFNTGLLGEKFEISMRPEGNIKGGKSEYAYIMEWHDFYAPKALYKIQKAGLRTKVNTKEVILKDGTTLAIGSILIPVKQQEQTPIQIYQILEEAIEGSGVNIYSVRSGNTNGINLGSPSFESLNQPKVAMIIGDGISPYDAGEIWFLMDQHYEMPITKIDVNDFRRADLSRYNVLIMPNGWGYGSIGGQKNKIQQWAQNGGTIIAYKSAAKWLSDQKVTKVKFADNKPDTTGYESYEDLGNNRGAQVIGGAIFEVELDLSHPLTYGLKNEKMPVFRNSTLFMEKSNNQYANPVRYTQSPLMNGYISEENAEKLKGTSAVTVSRVGGGKVISFTDNTNFRAFWYGTNRLLMNAIFYGQTISGRAGE
ncbi:peptidase M14 [Marivirga tractuosa]|uniref:Peptidase M14 carboxypeptidase A n=1 Tax=Marivirga tractuosa (strain ATCC 23168 / DSM 4126 / NBRC 15989 / NCIMB 1408 / VKM B-1430 / H-43) TaxID=643867 RepID=E4TSR9_MARTH|nr:M14 family metallopeptidase [Marivirga tractuosa]ADR21879.1 peptidase M14 carboxypeptidase A [Marivirga tractuosa DSM 4126]BDD13663.1 peptidase M14 [Marivirga tractuosa]